MKVVGITGRSGCGKSSVSALYRTLGYTCIDADEVARAVLQPDSPCIKLLQNAFGSDIVDEHGNLRRHLLADRAFATPQGTKRLTEITHPEILRRIDEALSKAREEGRCLVFVDGAVIVGTPFQARCDELILVRAPYEASVARICQRDGVDKTSAQRRLDAQTPETVLCAAADRIIENDGSLEKLHQQAQVLLNELHDTGK